MELTQLTDTSGDNHPNFSQNPSQPTFNSSTLPITDTIIQNDREIVILESENDDDALNDNVQATHQQTASSDKLSTAEEIDSITHPTTYIPVNCMHDMFSYLQRHIQSHTVGQSDFIFLSPPYVGQNLMGAHEWTRSRRMFLPIKTPIRVGNHQLKFGSL